MKLSQHIIDLHEEIAKSNLSTPSNVAYVRQRTPSQVISACPRNQLTTTLAQRRQHNPENKWRCCCRLPHHTKASAQAHPGAKCRETFCHCLVNLEPAKNYNAPRSTIEDPFRS
ncbi:hypothetical protein NPIL_636161 [Nephila pilipes]|uniref:Uncharacterized protein n=1 Tax=Nephila pilipes TaxID=299642 RepID=A0A8X6N4Z6_NEPPI|nr:hypothetical protein NPIL_636161 [Nephila pilipes]